MVSLCICIIVNTSNQFEPSCNDILCLNGFFGIFFFNRRYDFSVYAYFSDVIGKEFFPQSNKNTQLTLSFLVFGSAFFARPVGSILLGRLGDRYGTKVAIEISVIVMGLSSFSIGCLPTYRTSSWFAPIMLIILRSLQGLSVGGQYISSFLFSVEGINENNRGVEFAKVAALASFGFACGNGLSALLRAILSDEQLHDFGWRIPFWIGILVCISGLYLKYAFKGEEEAEGFDSLQHLKDSFNKENLIPMLCFFAVNSSGAVTFYVAFTWSVTWMDHLLSPPVKNAYLMSTLASLFSSVLLQPVFGYAVDRLKKKSLAVIITASLTGAFFPLGLYWIKKTRSPGIAFVVLSIIGIISSIQTPAVFCFFHDKFPPATRVTAMSFSYNVCLAIFGGSSPAVSTAIYKLNSLAPGYLATSTSILSIIGMSIAIHKTTKYSEQDSNTATSSDTCLSTPLLDATIPSVLNQKDETKEIL